MRNIVLRDFDFDSVRSRSINWALIDLRYVALKASADRASAQNRSGLRARLVARCVRSWLIHSGLASAGDF